MFAPQKNGSIFYKNHEIRWCYPLDAGFWQPVLAMSDVVAALGVHETKLSHRLRRRPLSNTFYRAPGSKMRWVAINALLYLGGSECEGFLEWLMETFGFHMFQKTDALHEKNLPEWLTYMLNMPDVFDEAYVQFFIDLLPEYESNLRAAKALIQEKARPDFGNFRKLTQAPTPKPSAR